MEPASKIHKNRRESNNLVMSKSFRIVLAQGNPVLGDIAGNERKALNALAEAQRLEADLLVLSELFITGYPPEDLILRPSFLDAVEAAIERLARATAGAPAILIGAPWDKDGHKNGHKDNQTTNSALLLSGGKIIARHEKVHLPNYTVFDEKRLFYAGAAPAPMQLGNMIFGAMVCEDIWLPDVSARMKEQGAGLLIVLNASPFETGKHDNRLDLAKARVRETGLPLLYVNQLGGQDELVFDGASFIIQPPDVITAQAPLWREALLASDWQHKGEVWQAERGEIAGAESETESIWQAVVMGLRDYVNKNGFPGVVLGLSGGIDSALCAAIAVDALGADRVHCLAMPSLYTSPASREDAKACAKKLGVRLDWLSIKDAHKTLRASLTELPDFSLSALADENLQARIRGVMLMAVSNTTGAMVITTGNKSEMSVGYATLYGDMNGGFNPIRDVYKMQVYELARWRNTHYPAGALGGGGEIIPPAIIAKAPSAELRPEQKDEDSLPPYAVLDDILRRLIDEEQSLAAIIAAGYDDALVRRIAGLVRGAEYTRRQAPPGVKIGPRPFGRGRRYPITNLYKG